MICWPNTTGSTRYNSRLPTSATDINLYQLFSALPQHAQLLGRGGESGEAEALPGGHAVKAIVTRTHYQYQEVS